MSTKIRLLIVDDEAMFVETLERIFTRAGMHVRTATRARAALQLLEQERADVMLCDIVMDGTDGMALLRSVKELADPPEVVMLTAHATIDSAVEAMRRGAYDYLQKPAEVPDVERAIRKAFDKVCLTRENARLRQRLQQHDPYQQLIGGGPAMTRLRELIGKVAPTGSTVLILGDSGVGKELVARMIHDGSDRAAGPFLTLNCGALQASVLQNELFGHVAGAFTGATRAAPGLFEAATDGTLFIDEIGEMDPDVQKAFLRVLESGEYRRMGETQARHADARVLAATNRDLRAEVEAGGFRKDLYFRLNVFTITVPPLREHPEDIPELVEGFLARVRPRRAEPARLEPDAMRSLLEHAWPGNVRELRNALERGVIMAGGRPISRADLWDLDPLEGPPAPEPPEAAAADPLPDRAGFRALHAVERDHILEALARSDGNKTKAARLLGVSLRSLYTKLQRLGLRD